MTVSEVAQMIESIGLPNAYYQFDEGQVKAPPFICFYYPNDDDFKADNINYSRINALTIELYTDNKNFDLEAQVESVLIQNALPFSKFETYINSEHMFQITYNTEVVING